MPCHGRHFAAPARLTCLSNVIIDERRNLARVTASCVPPVVSEFAHKGRKLVLRPLRRGRFAPVVVTLVAIASVVPTSTLPCRDIENELVNGQGLRLRAISYRRIRVCREICSGSTSGRFAEIGLSRYLDVT